jgi:hypothetical protein
MDRFLKPAIVGALVLLTAIVGAATAQDYSFLVRSEPINLLGQPTVNKDFAILSPPKVVNASQASGCQCGPDCPCAGAVQTVKNSRSKYRYVRYTDGSWKATPIANAVTVEEPSSITVYADDDVPSYGSSGSAYSGGYRTVYAPRSYYAPVARQSYTGGYYSSGAVRRGLFGGGRVFRAGGSCANGQCGF